MEDKVLKQPQSSPDINVKYSTTVGQVLLLVLGLDQCAETTGSKFPCVQNTHCKNTLMYSNIALLLNSVILSSD